MNYDQKALKLFLENQERAKNYRIEQQKVNDRVSIILLFVVVALAVISIMSALI